MMLKFVGKMLNGPPADIYVDPKAIHAIVCLDGTLDLRLAGGDFVCVDAEKGFALQQIWRARQDFVEVMGVDGPSRTAEPTVTP